MPLATRPNATYEMVLSTDANLPKNKQPVFVFRHLSILEWEEIAKLSDKFEAATDSVKMIDLAFEVIEKTLVNWQNMKTTSGKKIPFKLKKLKSMVSLQEATELMQAAVSQRPSFEDKKKLDSRLGSNMGRSVSPVKE